MPYLPNDKQNMQQIKKLEVFPDPLGPISV